MGMRVSQRQIIAGAAGSRSGAFERDDRLGKPGVPDHRGTDSRPRSGLQ
jgi:hypothetical protein